jgi:hypothetical protein
MSAGTPYRVLVLGGLGHFGARICRALSAAPGFDVLAAGRRPDAPAFGGIRFNAERVGLDADMPGLATRIRDLRAALVIHTAGPFQGQDYHVARAAAEAGAHYIDLADGRGFVAGFAAAVAGTATRHGVLAVTGASSVPGLSSAVVDALAPAFRQIDTIELCIAPAQQTARGTATMAAVLGYAGRPIRWLEDGRWKTVHGWLAHRRFRFAELPPRLAAACDVPDLELFPARYPGVRTVTFHAALEIGLQMHALATLACIRRAGLPLPLDRWAAALNRLSLAFDPFGGARGGMVVRVTGAGSDGNHAIREWHLTADDNHGPEIPCMAAILLAQQLARGDRTTRGAMPCTGLLRLDDFGPLFAQWGIRTRVIAA